MGQSASTTSRHDNASTRTLHSTSTHSNQPRSFLGRISNRLHKPRRFYRRRAQTTALNTVTAPSTTISVHHETQEAAWAASPILYHLQSQSAPSDSAHGGTVLSPDNTVSSEPPVNIENSNTSTPTGEQQPSSSSRDNTTTSDNHVLSFLALFQVPDHQEVMDAGGGDIIDIHDAIEQWEQQDTNDLPALLCLVLLSYFGGFTNDIPGSLQISPSEEASTNMEDQLRDAERYLAMMRALGPPFLSDTVTFEELLMLDSTLGHRPDTTTQSAVDEAIPVTVWSDTVMKKQLIGTDQCLVCLDEFINTQTVRILKCRHVFHRECVDRWLCESHNSCPVCRRVPVESNN
ncbi:hypothetical protein K501DRAFT_285819 [Backusella circina FSU 941]|nr:hypothetical protein K501DRAFT_285819 [Backusella circina FSU 941]